jgi:ribosomal protein S18 acetylase RimI-like enzyme
MYIEKDDNMSKYIYMTISKTSPIFNKICDYCDKKIVEENLSINGGTLNYSGIVYDSDILIVCLDKTTPIAFNSIVELNDCIYIYQIAVKNANKREGIGTELMQKAITIAEGKKKPVAAHVRDYNDASNHLFQKLGFTAVEPSSNTLYILDTIKKSRGKK